MDGTRVTASQTKTLDEREPAIRVGGRHVADRALTLHPVGQLFPSIDPANPIQYNNTHFQFSFQDSKHNDCILVSWIISDGVEVSHVVKGHEERAVDSA